MPARAMRVLKLAGSGGRGWNQARVCAPWCVISAAAHNAMRNKQGEHMQMTDISSRSHRFKIGGVVKLVADTHRRGGENDLYKVVRLLPAEGQEYQYRIKDSRTGAEYIVIESALK
jgi:hypothetical protein